MEDDATNPVVADDTSAEETETVQPDTEVEQELSPELDEDGNPVEPEPEEIEEDEIELDDLKLKLPKDQAAKLKEAILRQADYTRKTQALAEERKSLQQERSTLMQATNAEIAALASAQAAAAEIAQFEDIDWDTWYEQDPMSAQRAESKLRRLRDSQQAGMNQLNQLRQQRTLHEQRENARLIEEGRQVLMRDIKGWDEPLARSLVETGVKEYGFARDEIEDFTDPRMVKVLHDAHQWRQAQAKQKVVQKNVTAQAVKPAERVRAKAAPVAGLDDRLSADEWLRRRNEQLRKRG